MPASPAQHNAMQLVTKTTCFCRAILALLIRFPWDPDWGNARIGFGVCYGGTDGRSGHTMSSIWGPTAPCAAGDRRRSPSGRQSPFGIPSRRGSWFLCGCGRSRRSSAYDAPCDPVAHGLGRLGFALLLPFRQVRTRSDSSCNTVPWCRRGSLGLAEIGVAKHRIPGEEELLRVIHRDRHGVGHLHLRRMIIAAGHGH